MPTTRRRTAVRRRNPKYGPSGLVTRINDVKRQVRDLWNDVLEHAEGTENERAERALLHISAALEELSEARSLISGR